MLITASELRQNIYRLIDQVLETGIPIEIKRKGEILKIFPPEKVNKLNKLKKRKGLLCKPEKIINTNWDKEWKPYI